MHWLVSLREPGELPAALSAEVDILDLKDVERGPLGMASMATISEFARQLQRSAPDRLCSVALGELTEWPHDRPPVSLPENVGWAKLGLSRCHTAPNWTNHWTDVRRQIDQASGRALRWIAVAYADFEMAKAPSPEDICEAAIATSCWGLLIDTYSKSGKSLLDWLGTDRLKRLITQSHAAKLRVALAGQVSVDDLPILVELQADIVAVRSAVCMSEIRTNRLCPERLFEFRQQLREATGHRDPAKA